MKQEIMASVRVDALVPTPYPGGFGMGGRWGLGARRIPRNAVHRTRVLEVPLTLYFRPRMLIRRHGVLFR